MSRVFNSFHGWLQTRSPETRRMFIGMSHAFNPMPWRLYYSHIRSDAKAVEADWRHVGNDLGKAIDHVANERR